MTEKESLFIYLLNSGLMKYRVIIMSLFSILEKTMTVKVFDNGSVSFNQVPVFNYDNEEYKATWFKEGAALYHPKESIKIKAGTIRNVKKDTDTTYGRLLVNDLLLTQNIGEKIDFTDGNWIKDGILKNIMSRVAKDDSIDAKQAHNFVDALQFIASLTQFCVPSASEKSLSTDPKIAKRKLELLEKYKDKLNDPAVISAIEQELVAMDRDWLKGDISEGFYKSGKDFNVSRKRMFIMHGGEKSFIDDNKIEVTKFSLADGWDLKELPKVVNSLRDGAYGRGTATAMGGERVKKFQQTFQNSRISLEDCGTNKGADFIINEYNKSFFIGRTLMNKKILTEDIINNYIGKTVTIRSPLFCKAAKTDYCEICSGMKMSDNPNVINTLTASIGSVFMSLEMKATHGKELLTANYDPVNCIS